MSGPATGTSETRARHGSGPDVFGARGQHVARPQESWLAGVEGDPAPCAPGGKIQGFICFMEIP